MTSIKDTILGGNDKYMIIGGQVVNILVNTKKEDTD
jgi:hypothetical protein